LPPAPHGKTTAVPTEQAMKQALQAYIDAFNHVDPEAIIALYADNATVEDPVGSEVKVGKQKIAEFYRMAIATGAKLKLAAPIRASHGNSAAMAFDVKLNMPQGHAVIRVIDVMSFDEHGKFASMRAYWGPSDMELLKA
jgi:steroid delta-isomerase